MSRTFAGRREAMDELTLLVVDDDADIRLYVRQCVLGDGDRIGKVIEAADGESALTALRTHRPDVLVCDVFLPRLSGYALCERLRADPATSRIPVLLLTGGTTPDETTRRAREAGADGVLFKPFNARRLCDAIERVIRRARDAPEPASSDPARGGEVCEDRGNQPTGGES